MDKKGEVPYRFVTFSGDPDHARRIAREAGYCQSPGGAAERQQRKGNVKALVVIGVLAVVLLLAFILFLPEEDRMTAAGTLSKDKLHNWVDPQQVVTLNILNTLDGAPADALDLSEPGDRSVLGWMDGNTLNLAGKGGVKAPGDCSYLFSVKGAWEDSNAHKRWNKLERVNGGAWLDTSSVTNMVCMFACCSSLTKLNVSHWDTSTVTDMGFIFSDCTSLTELDVSRWDTSSVTDMNAMFQDCPSLTELDVSRWDTSTVTDMGFMLSYCTSLTELDVSHWDTSSVTDMSYLFAHYTSLTEPDVSRWNTSSVTNMRGVFYDCTSLTELDVSRWDTSSVTDMDAMFQDCPSLTELDVSRWDTSSVTDMSYTFSGCTSLTKLDVSRWDISKVEKTEEIFNGTKWESNPPYPFKR